MLRPEHAKHPELHRIRRALQGFDDDPVFLRCQRNFTQCASVDCVESHETSTRIALSATERNSLSPSVPPSSASAHRSGCGIMPSTLPRLLMIPAMLCSEPFGLAFGRTRPSTSQ